MSWGQISSMKKVLFDRNTTLRSIKILTDMDDIAQAKSSNYSVFNDKILVNHILVAKQVFYTNCTLKKAYVTLFIV